MQGDGAPDSKFSCYRIVSMRVVELGGLRVRIAGGTDREGAGEGPVVVLLHGFGAPGDDLASLWRVLRAPAGTRFVFPEAPLSLAALGMPGGRAWWTIDMARLQRTRTPEQALQMMAEVPPGLAAARENVLAMLEAMKAALKPSKLVIGGFSQGAMLSVDVALRSDLALAGVVVMSGALIAEPEWRPLVAKRKGLPILQSHGTRDPILPFLAGERLAELLKSAGLAHTWVPFPGEHAIPPGVVDAVGQFLETNLA
jgi:phospholipase/carboxylesterase